MKFKGSYLSYVMMNFFYSMSLALLTSLLAIYLVDRGFTSVDVALVVSLGLFCSIGSQPLIGILNDKFNAKKVNMLLLGISIIGILLFLKVSHIWLIAISYAFVFSLINGVNPAVEKMATTSPYRYGTIRVWGTFGFAVGVQISGIVYGAISGEAVYMLYIVATLLAIIGLWQTDDTPSLEHIHDAKEHLPLKSLFSNKSYLLYLLMVFFFYGAPNVSGIYIPSMLVYNGLDVSLASTVVFIAVLCEFPFVLFSYLFMDRVKSKHLLMIVFSLFILQFGLFAFTSGVEMKVLATLLFKHTLGMTFIMTNLKVVKMLIPPTIQVSALGLVGMVSSISAIVLNPIAGTVIEQFGYEACYMMLMVCVAIALLICCVTKIEDKPDVKLFH